MASYYSVQFAQAYGQGSYNTCVYNDATSCRASAGGSTGNANSAAGGGLSNTGLMILLVVSAACLIAFVALLARFWRKPNKQLATEEVAEDTNNEDDRPDTGASAV